MREAILLTDGYKLDHRRQYPEGTEYVYSNWTPRSCHYMPDAEEGVVVFGIQYFIKEYLIKQFHLNFFDKPRDVAVAEFARRVNTFLGPNEVGTKHIEELWDLQYLPIRIKALPEGTLCPIKVPALTFINTHPDFFWLTNYFETLISTTLWLPMTSATSARLAKKELVRHAKKTGFSEEVNLNFLIHDFSMRGMAGVEAAIMSGMGHMTSFCGSETIPAIAALEEYYNADAEKELIAATIPATEHSVMCAGGKDDEFETFKRLITEVYPSGYVSIVSDTWDYWKVITDYLPRLKDEILARDGRVVIRPDSGDPVDIICGVEADVVHIPEEGFESVAEAESFYEEVILSRVREITPHGKCGPKSYSMVFEYNGTYTKITLKNIGWNRYDKQYYYIDMWEKAKFECETLDPTIYKGSYEILWDLFGGTVNDKGFKVLDSHIGIIYGDSIDLDKEKEIYRRLEEKKFAATNLVLGYGSYTYQFKSRDSLGFAMKATWCQISGDPYDIFEDPKTDDGVKKSLKGLIMVGLDEYGNYHAYDQVSKVLEKEGYLQTVFEDDKLLVDWTLEDIRRNINASI